MIVCRSCNKFSIVEFDHCPYCGSKNVAERIYMATTKDRFEFPVAVAGSPKELADKIGVSANRVCDYSKKQAKGFCRVDIEEGYDEV